MDFAAQNLNQSGNYNAMRLIVSVSLLRLLSISRFIFNLIHGSGIGFLTQAFARKQVLISTYFLLQLCLTSTVVNVGLGMALFQSGCLKLSKNNHILWIYIIWIAFFVIYQGSLFFIFLISSLKNNGSSIIYFIVIFLAVIVIYFNFL